MQRTSKQSPKQSVYDILLYTKNLPSKKLHGAVWGRPGPPPPLDLPLVRRTARCRSISQKVEHDLTTHAIKPCNTVKLSKSLFVQWLKWFCEAGGAHLTKPGWRKPHTHSNPTNLALFRRKITLYRVNQGGSYYCRGLKLEQGAEPPLAPSL